GTPREQAIIFPETVEEYISDDNPVRFIDAFVDQLDLQAAGFQRTLPSETGRPPYAPGDLLKLYIYGYLNRIRSSRKLEQEAARNVEVMWLLRKLKPDFKTIADFRKDNRNAFKQVFREFILLCRKLELFGGELVAVDGSKFKAVNNSKRNFTKARLQKTLKRIDEKIEGYLNELDECDSKSPSPKRYSVAELESKIEHLKDRQDRYGQLLQEIEESGETQISLTDADSRSMAKSPKAPVSYNVQTAVDEKHKLIVTQDVTNAVTDRDQLSKIAIQAKEALGVEKLKVVADMGYSHGKEIKACEEAGLEPYVPTPVTSANRKLGLYGKEQFFYDVEKDVYRCPAGQELTYRFDTHELGRHIRYYKTSACRTCAIKAKCTRNKEGRRITRWVDEHIMERMQVRIDANPDLMKKRKQIVEHPFGTIKYWNDQGHFLMRGLENVRAEFSLSALIYNLKRIINTLGVPKMLEALA
ncbi:MAG: IS1182 family transposase, partial [Anaerolineales bacterium]